MARRTRTADRPTRYKSPEDRFLSRVAKAEPHDCWLWRGCLSADGYGSLEIDGKSVLAHRFAYELANGAVGSGLCVCHHCDTPACVNPAHLFVGTHTDNMRDEVRKGRYWSAKRVAAMKGEGHKLAKLSNADAVAIRVSNARVKDLAAMYRVSTMTIWRVKTNRRAA